MKSARKLVEFLRGEVFGRRISFFDYLYGVILNFESTEFSDARIRESLNYAIDRQKSSLRPSADTVFPQRSRLAATLGVRCVTTAIHTTQRGAPLDLRQ